MEKNDTCRMTPFDSLVQSNHLQMLKAALPYVGNSEQLLLSVYVKMSELTNTFRLFQDSGDTLSACSAVPAREKGPIPMLNDIKTYCTGPERESIDMMLNFFQASQLYQFSQSFTPDQEAYAEKEDYSAEEENSIQEEDFIQEDNSYLQAASHTQTYEAPELKRQEPETNSSETLNQQSTPKQNSGFSFPPSFSKQALESLLSPEQKRMYNTYSTLLQTMQLMNNSAPSGHETNET